MAASVDDLPWCMLGDVPEDAVPCTVPRSYAFASQTVECNIEQLLRRHWAGLQAYMAALASDHSRVNRALRSSAPGEVTADTFIPSRGFTVGQMAILSSQHRKMSSKAARERAAAAKATGKKAGVE